MTAFILFCGLKQNSCVAVNSPCTIGEIINSRLCTESLLSCDDLYVTCNGRLVGIDDCLQDHHVYNVCPRLIGGKGGFGSMLRAIGAQIEKTTSREACRDLSGRRMRDVNNEKSLKEWIGKQADREKEKEDRRQERRERRLAMPRHKFEDELYEQQKSEVAEKQNEALDIGLKKMQTKPTATVTSNESSTSQFCRKRKAETVASVVKIKKQTEWLGVDLENLSDMDSEEEDGACPVDVGSSPEKISKITDSDGMKKGHISNDSESSVSVSVDIDMTSSNQDVSNEVDKEMGSSEGNVDKNRNDHIGKLSIMQKADGVPSGAKTDGTEESRKDEQKKHGLLTALSTVKSGTEQEEQPLSVDDCISVAELETLGLDRLKAALMEQGLKCGGTLQQRAERLMAVKGLTKEEIDPSLFAKTKPGKKK